MTLVREDSPHPGVRQPSLLGDLPQWRSFGVALAHQLVPSLSEGREACGDLRQLLGGVHQSTHTRTPPRSTTLTGLVDADEALLGPLGRLDLVSCGGGAVERLRPPESPSKRS